MWRDAYATNTVRCLRLAGLGLLAFFTVLTLSPVAGATDNDNKCNGQGSGKDHSGDGSVQCGGTTGADTTPPTITFSAQSPAKNGAGWNNGSVSIAFTVTDNVGVTSVNKTSPLTFSSEGSGQTQSVTACDAAGNCRTAASPAVSIDMTAPSLSGSGSPAANGAGWNNTAVLVTFSCSDSLSGVGSNTSPISLGEGANQTASGSCADKAGNSSNASAGPFNIDLTAPSLAASRAPDGNAAGWNNADVTVSYACTDALSGVGSVSPNDVVSSEGAGQSRTGTCSDRAGNSASASIAGISIDKTAPSIAGAADRPANGAGWYNADVTVSFTASDALSGIESASGPSSIGEGANQSVTGTATDRAGNSASATVGSINVDKTAPSIAGSREPAANANGWNNIDVTASFTCSDALSGLAAGSPPAPTHLSSEGAGQSASGSCSDLAGNSASGEVHDISIDKTAPTISGAPDRAPNASGWYDASVTVSFTGADALSGLDSVTSPVTVGEGAGQNIQGTATDRAGNSAMANVGPLNVDLTGPVITVAQNPPANAQGWNNTDVTVNFICTDAGSGVAGGQPAPASFNTEGEGQTASASCSDLAGHTSTLNHQVSIDKTAPTITGAATTPPTPQGWYSGDVTVHFECSDSLSGLFGFVPDAQVTQTGSAGGVCTDNAGNSASATVPIQIDNGAPVLTGLTAPSLLFYNANFTITASGADTGSGFVSSQLTYTIQGQSTNKAFPHNLELAVTDAWTQRAIKIGSFSIKWAGTDAAANVRDPDFEGGVRLPDTPGAFAGAFLSPVPNSQFNSGRTLPIKFKFVDVDGNPLPEFCGAVVVSQGSVSNSLNAPWDGTQCQINHELNYAPGPLTISLPRDDDGVLGYTRSITINVQ